MRFPRSALLLLGLLASALVNAASPGAAEPAQSAGGALDLEITRWAAEEGQAWAQAALAAAYLNGEGVERDFVQAAAWLERAADQGHVIAQAALARMYQFGLGVAQDDRRAARWARLAAAQGHVEAQRDLGGFYLRGTGVDLDLGQAAYWLQLAADQGDAASVIKLSTLELPQPPRPAVLLEAVDIDREER